MNKWIQITVTIDNEHAELTADYFQALDALAVHLYAASAEDVFGEDLKMQELWRINYVSALYPEDTDIQPIIHTLQTWLNRQLDIKSEIVEEQDWVRSTQSQFPPKDFGGIWVYPSWYSDQKEEPQITINPGLAFGTGTHPTTRLCLEYLAQHPPIHKTVIDYGCGSGILSLAADCLGAARVTGTDHDEQAITAGQDNLHLNPDLHTTAFYLNSAMPATKADLVIANIISSVLKKLYPALRQHTQDGGTLLLSGILQSEAASVIEYYTKDFTFTKQYHCDEWCAIELSLH